MNDSHRLAEVIKFVRVEVGSSICEKDLWGAKEAKPGFEDVDNRCRGRRLDSLCKWVSRVAVYHDNVVVGFVHGHIEATGVHWIERQLMNHEFWFLSW